MIKTIAKTTLWPSFMLAGLLASSIAAPLAAQNGKQATTRAGPSDAQSAQISQLEGEGNRLLEAGQVDAAEPIYRELLRLNRETRGNRAPQTIFAAINLARVLAAVGQLEEADRLFVSGLTMAREQFGDRSPDTLSALHDYANLLSQRGELQASADMFSVAVRLRREVLGEGDAGTLSSMANHAFVLEKLGRAEDAEPLASAALRGAVALYGEGHPGTLESLNIYTGVLNALGRLQEAEPFYVEAVRIGRESLGEAHPLTVRAINNYAVLMLDLFRPEEAEPYASEAVRLSRESLGEAHPITLVARSTYAQALQMLQRRQEALPLLEQNLAVYRETLGERHPVTLFAMNNYAGGLIEVDRPAEAEPIFAEVLRVRREVLGETHPDTLFSISNYATALSQLNRREEAAQMAAELVRLRTEALGSRHPDTLRTINNYGALLSELDRFAEAEALYRATLPVVREVLGEHSIAALTMMRSQALVLAELGQPQPALALVREVVDELRARDARFSIGGIDGDAQRTREGAIQRTNEGILADMLWAAQAASDDAPGLRTDAFTALQLASAGSASRAVTEAAAARFASGQGLREVVDERQQRVAEWTATEAELLAAVTGGADRAEDRAALRMRLDATEQRLSELDARIAREAPQYFAILRQQAVTLDELRAVLGEDEAMLFLVSGRDGTHSMAVTRDTIAWQRSDQDGEAIARSVADLRRGLEIRAGEENLPVFDLALANDLYVDLIEPVETALAGKSRVYVVTDGALSRLPLGTLLTQAPDPGVDPEDAETLRNAPWLADRYALVQIPSVQSLVYIRTFGVEGTTGGDAAYAGFGAPVLSDEARTRGARSATLDPVDASGLVSSVRAGGKFVLMNPEALRKLASLPGTRSELEKVAGAVGGGSSRLWLASEMTESAIRSADLSATRILHLATHGFTSEEAGSLAEPGLVFTPPIQAGADDDGYLAASEVVALDLDAARWVILSACNTASPSGKPGETGLSGLAQAFFYAGAESLLVSHWPVFDDIAPLLTTETLRRSEAGMPRAEALQAAIRAIREDPALDAAHPAVWAPFTLVGEGR